ncbi:MAG: cation diffusion facilitator family transporter [Pseudomonadota bacterium]
MTDRPTDVNDGQAHSHLHSHDHAHSHAHAFGHAHGVSDLENNGRKLFVAAALIGGFMFIEVVGGLISGSLALLADAGHMLSDFASLVLAWYAFHISKKPATADFSYGRDRLQVVAAFVNALTMFFIGIWITVEAVGRLLQPVDVLSGTMMAVALVGLLVNIVAFFVLSSADKDNLNVRGAMMHVIGDLLGSVAAILAAGIIMATGWIIVDPLLSLLVVAIIARGAYPVLRQAGHILLEGTPQELDTDDIRTDVITNVDGVSEIHHFHIWSLTQARPMATLHAVLIEGANIGHVISGIKGRLLHHHGIDHATVEVEYGTCADDGVTCGAGVKDDH